MGVTLFYALSGLLMGYLYLHKPWSAEVVRGYAVSRCARVLPLYFAVIAIALLFFSAFGQDAYLIDGAWDVWASLFMLQGAGVLWSVPVEIHFYILFAALWFMRAPEFRVAIGVVLGVQILAMVVLRGDYGNAYLVFWAHIFIVGMLLGWAYRASPQPFRRIANARSWRIATYVTLASAVVVLPGTRRLLDVPIGPPFLDPVSVGYPLFFLFGALLGTGAFRLLKVFWLRWLGQVSFGVYLLHMPVIVLVSKSEVGDTWLAAPLVVVCSLALAQAALIGIERPMQAFLKMRLSPARTCQAGPKGPNPAKSAARTCAEYDDPQKARL